MTISDCIAQLTRLMKEVGPSAQVKIGSAYNSTENPFDAFVIRKQMCSKEIYLVPSDIWIQENFKRRNAYSPQSMER